MNVKRLFILFLCIPLFSVGQVQKKLPTLATIHSLDQPSKLLQQSLPTKGKIVFIFYDPGCGHCQELGASLTKEYASFATAQVYFITMNEKSLVTTYINKYTSGLKDKKNVSFWKDPGVEFIEKFMPRSYPATYVFDAASKNLIKDFQGENDAKKIIPFLR